MEFYEMEVLESPLCGNVLETTESCLAGHTFVDLSEELVAQVLDEIGVRWIYEGARVVQRAPGGEIVAEVTLDFLLLGLEHPIMIEVKQRAVGNRRQRHLAEKAGYGCAYVVGMIEATGAERLAKVMTAINEALLRAPAAIHVANSLGEARPRVESVLRLRLRRVAKAG